MDGTLRRYDDYGNISFGVFGKAAGFTDPELFKGSALIQARKTTFGNTSGSGDELRDVYMIQTGIYNYQFLLKKMIPRLGLFLAIISLSGCSNKKIELDKLELRDNFYYLPNTSSKFSGTGFTKLSNGKISNEIKFEGGVPKGRWFAYGYDHELVQEGSYRPIEFAGNGGILADQVALDFIKPVGALGSQSGSSLASFVLSKRFPQSVPLLKKIPRKIVGIVSKKAAGKVGTAVLGRVLGRLVPYVGWAILASDIWDNRQDLGGAMKEWAGGNDASTNWMRNPDGSKKVDYEILK